MRARTYLISSVASFTVATLAALASAAAGDAAFCVACTGPDQTYLCKVTGEDVRPDDALKLFCIVRTAKEGGHASCGARSEVANCPGMTKVYAYDGPSLPADVGQAATVEAGIDEAFDQQPEDESPKTLVEAYSASRQGMRNVRARFGRGEPGAQAALPSSIPSDALPASAAEPGTLPELPGGEPSPLTPLPSTMVPEPATDAALFPPGDASASDPAPAESKGRIRRGANNVGKFAKKSYRCVRTLFRRCREQPEIVAPN